MISFPAGSIVIVPVPKHAGLLLSASIMTDCEHGLHVRTDSLLVHKCFVQLLSNIMGC